MITLFLRFTGVLLFIASLGFQQSPVQAKDNSLATPLETVTAVKQSLETKNYALFKQAVDLQAIMEQAIREGVPLVRKNLQSSDFEIPPAAQLALSALDVTKPSDVTILATLLTSELDAVLKQGVESGAFGQGAPAAKPTDSLFFRNLAMSKKTWIPGKVISSHGDKAIASAELHDAKAGVFPVRLGLTKQDGLWRITSLENLSELFTWGSKK